MEMVGRIQNMKRCMETWEGVVTIDDGEDILFTNTVVQDDSDKSELHKLFCEKVCLRMLDFQN